MDNAATIAAKLAVTLAQPTARAPTLVVEELVLPPAVPGLTRADASSLVLALLLHVAVFAAVQSPERQLGIGGLDPDAIGIEIVTLAPALEARADARGRGAAANRQVAENDGDSEPIAEQAAAPDSSRDDQPLPNEAATPPADLVVPEWTEPQRPPDAPATEPIIARYKGEGVAPEMPERLRPSLTDQPSAAADSRSAAEVLARFRGGAAARGRETADVTSIVMPAARAGLRNEFQIELFKALSGSQPVRPAGLRGEVKVEFFVQRTGSIGEIRIVRSSGFPRLDEAVITAIRAARIPAPPPGLDDAMLWFDVPYTFQ